MSLERLQPFTLQENGPRKMESIFKYYSIPNEINFVRNLDGQRINPDDTRYYVTENVYHFLGEFAGKIPYASVSFTQGERDLEYAGIELSSSYENTALLGGKGSREEDEWIGYQKITKAFMEGQPSVVWISPPKIADYGFVFYFERNPDDPTKIKEYILKYDEPMGSTEKSTDILHAIDPEKNFETDTDFLQNPVSIAPSDLSTVLSAVGTSNEDIVKSFEFEEQAREKLAPWIEKYVDAVFNGRFDDAKLSLTAIYNYAGDIRSVVDELPGYFEQPEMTKKQSFRSLPNKEHLFAYYAKKEAQTSGGSCPVVNDGGDPLSPFNLLKSLKAGKSPNKVVEENSYFVCPKCKHEADGPVGNTCPNCGLTKEEHAKQGAAVC